MAKPTQLKDGITLQRVRKGLYHLRVSDPDRAGGWYRMIIPGELLKLSPESLVQHVAAQKRPRGIMFERGCVDDGVTLLDTVRLPNSEAAVVLAELLGIPTALSSRKRP